jgi:nucleosome assembly protein 1-like 1
MGFA